MHAPSLKTFLLMIVLMLAAVLARVTLEARAALQSADSAREAGQLEAAVSAYERALHWHIPLSPHVHRAAGALAELGSQAEAAGQLELARTAYQALRGGIYASRSFYTPEPELLALANDRLATLQATDHDAQWPDPALSEAQRKGVALEVLERDPAPAVGWSALSVFGFLVWVGCAVAFCLRAVDPEGRFQALAGQRWGAGIVLGYALWIVGLMRA